ncbi:MAG: hypothetical protein JSV96_04410 [Candidatus Aminicenantes bacterium]|nr:MAG: hypothetical protein JSV96_04410 [Candidatus Aminicenantes bacterium]
MSDQPDLILKFHKDGPFFYMITAFTIAFAGVEPFIDSRNPMNYKPYPAKSGFVLNGKVFPQFVVFPYDLFVRFQKKEISHRKISISFCTMLINTAYESVKEKNNQTPIFEFFRHVRNASSHRNEFFFKSKEPKRITEWRGKIIDHNLKGNNNPLFEKECFFNFLGPADALYLLSDIEQQIFQAP